MQKIFAHRGASGCAPENTLEAFALAAQQGAHGVELDVHMTKDGEIVVAHDETIDRVADGSGLIQEMTLAELKGFHFNKLMPQFADAVIPTLREVLELLRPNGLEVNIEVKSDRTLYEGIEEKTMNIVAAAGMEEKVLYSSFNHYTLGTIKQLNEKAVCGLLYSEIMMRPWTYANELGMDALHPHYRQLVVPGVVSQAHKAGVMVNPWTVDDEAVLKWVIAIGADIIITNYPDRALKLLKRYEEADTADREVPKMPWQA